MASTEDLMTTLLDTSADPCQDFYKYSCGGWTNRFTLRPDQVNLGERRLVLLFKFLLRPGVQY